VVTTPTVTGDPFINLYNEAGPFLNYSRVYELYGKQYNLSPRKQFCSLLMGSESIDSLVMTSNYDPLTGLPTSTHTYSS
jgi:hypothetical protein